MKGRRWPGSRNACARGPQLPPPAPKCSLADKRRRVPRRTMRVLRLGSNAAVTPNWRMTVSSRKALPICFTLAAIANAVFPSSGFSQDRQRAASSRESTTVVACVARSADYVRATTAAADTGQLLLTDVRSGTPTHNLTGVREQDLMPYLGQRVEITGTIERARTTPVLTTAEGAVTGSVNSERPPAAGVTPEGAAAHEPSDALAATVPAGRVAEPTRISDPAYLVAVLPAMNAASFRRVAGACAPPPADRAPNAAAGERRAGQTPAATALPQQARSADRIDRITARGCLVRQTAGGTALTPQASPTDVLVLANASLIAAPLDAARGAVPGSAPADAGSGTVPPAAGTSGQAPVDAGTVSYTLSLASGNTRELMEHVGDRIEVTGTLEASSQSDTSDRRAVQQEAPAAAGPGRVQVAPVEVAHVSTPARRIAVTTFRAVGGACN